MKNDQWIPDRPPDVLLPPDKEPEISMEELLDTDLEAYGRLYYMRSGRYLGGYESWEEAGAADKYRFVRQFLPGGVLPWEKYTS